MVKDHLGKLRLECTSCSSDNDNCCEYEKPEINVFPRLRRKCLNCGCSPEEHALGTVEDLLAIHESTDINSFTPKRKIFDDFDVTRCSKKMCLNIKNSAQDKHNEQSSCRFRSGTEKKTKKASDIFISGLTDVQMLKTCRLVCQSWNIAASESLRTCSVLSIHEGCVSKLIDFTHILMRRFLPFDDLSQQLPSPFKNFGAAGIAFTNVTFLPLLLQPNNTSLRMKLRKSIPNLHELQLGLVLAANRTKITDLIASGKERFEIGQALASDEIINLTALNELPRILKLGIGGDSSRKLMDQILSNCKLGRVDLNAFGPESLANWLTQKEAKNLKNFVLKFDEFVSAEDWEHLSKLKFVSLRRLTLETDNPYNMEGQIQGLKPFFENVSQFLEDLTTNVPIGSISELGFPKLTTIKVDNNTRLSIFTLDKFPSLTKVTYDVTNPLLEIVNNCVFPHLGVQSVAIIADEMQNNKKSCDQDLFILLTYVSRQFPNASSLQLFTTEFRDTTLNDICECFPKLQRLGLDGGCDFFALSGMRKSMVVEYLEKGWDVQEIPRQKSILDFTELKLVSFGRAFTLEPDMIIHCLARLPKLKQFEFHWKMRSSAPLILDTRWSQLVSHLEQIVIVKSLIATNVEARFQAEMAQMSKMLPNVCVSCEQRS